MAQVRISTGTHQLLRSLASETRRPMQEIIDQALEDYRRNQFLRGLDNDFRVMGESGANRDDYDLDLSEWDETLADGLIDDEDPTR